MRPLFPATFPTLNRTFSVADASVALGRIGTYLTAEELADPYKIDNSSPYAISVDGDFQWETTHKAALGGPKFQGGKHGQKKPKEPKEQSEKKTDKRGLFGKKKADVLPTSDKKDPEKDKVEEKPFQLPGLKLQIPKGAFVAIVGRVGSGKVLLVAMAYIVYTYTAW